MPEFDNQAKVTFPPYPFPVFGLGDNSISEANVIEDMDIDQGAAKTAKSRARRSEGVQKRDKRKSRTSIVFNKHPKTFPKRR